MAFTQKCFIFFCFAAALFQASVANSNYTVGGSAGWTIKGDPNEYTGWAANQTFKVADSFGFRILEPKEPQIQGSQIPVTPTPSRPQGGTKWFQFGGFSDREPSTSNGLNACFTLKNSVSQTSKINYFSEGYTSNGVIACVAPKGFKDQTNRFNYFPEASTSNVVTASLLSKDSVNQNSRFNNCPEGSSANGLIACLTSKGYVDQNSRFSYSQEASSSNGLLYVDHNSRFKAWDPNLLGRKLISNDIVDSSAETFPRANTGSKSLSNVAFGAALASTSGLLREDSDAGSSPFFPGFYPQIKGNHPMIQTTTSGAACLMQDGNDIVVSNPFLKTTSQNQRNQQLHSDHNPMLLANPHSNTWTNSKSPISQCGFNVPYHPIYDLNALDRTLSDAFFKGNTRCLIAPITPDNGMKVLSQHSKVPDSCTYQDAHEKKQLLIAPTVDEAIHDSMLAEVVVVSSSSEGPSSPVKENLNRQKIEEREIDLNLTPEQKSEPKPRRKKHRPKVVIKGKLKRTPKPKQGHPKEKPSVKRNVKRKGLNALTTPAEVSRSTEKEVPITGTSVNRTRRALNFDLESQPSEVNDGKALGHQECPYLLDSKEKYSFNNQVQDPCPRTHCDDGAKSMLQQAQGVETTKKHPLAVLMFDLNRSSSEMSSNYISLLEESAPTITLSHAMKEQAKIPTNNSNNAVSFIDIDENGFPAIHQNFLSYDDQVLIDEDAKHLTEKKRESEISETILHNLPGRNGHSKGGNNIGLNCTKSCKRKRTEKGQIKLIPRSLSSKTTSESSLAYKNNVSRINYFSSQANFEGSTHQSHNINGTGSLSQFNWWSHSVDREQTFQEQTMSTDLVSQMARSNSIRKRQRYSKIMSILRKAKWKKKKRSKRPTRLRNLASLTAVALCNQFQVISPKAVQTKIFHGAKGCIKTLLLASHENIPKKPRSKRTPRVNSVLLRRNRGVLRDYYCQILGKSEGKRNTIEAHEPNALVPFHQQRALAPLHKVNTIVPYEGPIDHTKEHKPRAKVDLDPETERVWKLLMVNDGTEGVEKTSADRERWWEEERQLFRGRVESFISIMQLVQGDRRFLPWKGSVVDSVVGVFLTQNVTDHFSSSAFMSLAARYPLQSSSNHRACYGKWTNMYSEQSEVDKLNLNDTLESNGKVYIESTYGQGPVTFGEAKHMEERGEDNINELIQSMMGIQKASSVKAVIPSSNSPDSVRKSVVRIGSSMATNMEAQNCPFRENTDFIDGSSSFMELLSMSPAAVAQDYYNYDSERLSLAFDAKSMYTQLKGSQFNIGSSYMGGINGLGETFESISPTNIHLPFARVRDDPYISLIEDPADPLISSIHEAKFENHQNFCNDLHMERSLNFIPEDAPVAKTCNHVEALPETRYSGMIGNQSNVLRFSNVGIGESVFAVSNEHTDNKSFESNLNEKVHLDDKVSDIVNDGSSKANRKAGKEEKATFDWDSLRKEVHLKGIQRERTSRTCDSVDWEAVRCADVNEIARTIKERGMNNMLAERIKDFLNRIVREHESIDLEWLRDVPPDKAKEFLLSVWGLGLKSVECVRLLALHHHAFPVDTNVARIAVRLGWVPLQPLPEDLQIHLLELYPMLESVQKYLWPRLCKLDQQTLYALHYQMITFGKVFCTKKQPNCNACPLRAECRHFASAFASAKLTLPAPEEKSVVPSTVSTSADSNPAMHTIPIPLPLPEANLLSRNHMLWPVIEEPTSPEPHCPEMLMPDIEDAFIEDPDEIPTIKLNMEELSLNLQNFVQKNNMGLQGDDLSKALVSLTPAAASIPLPKLKTVTRLRTEHQVYLLPDDHPLLKELQLETRESDDPCNYLLAMWTPGEIAESMQPPDGGSVKADDLCNKNVIQEENEQTVRGTILIPSKTAMRGSFPLNGTYFQVNEVFADHQSSLNPISVPREWIWNLERRTVFFGTSVTAIFRGLSMDVIQSCFWRGFVCVRGFEQKTRAPRPLAKRFHISASRLGKTANKRNET